MDALLRENLKRLKSLKSDEKKLEYFQREFDYYDKLPWSLFANYIKFASRLSEFSNPEFRKFAFSNFLEVIDNYQKNLSKNNILFLREYFNADGTPKETSKIFIEIMKSDLPTIVKSVVYESAINLREREFFLNQLTKEMKNEVKKFEHSERDLKKKYNGPSGI